MRCQGQGTRQFSGADGVVAFDDYRTAHAPGVAAASWGAVLNQGLRPFAVTARTMYGTWGDPSRTSTGSRRGPPGTTTTTAPSTRSPVTRSHACPLAERSNAAEAVLPPGVTAGRVERQAQAAALIVLHKIRYSLCRSVRPPIHTGAMALTMTDIYHGTTAPTASSTVPAPSCTPGRGMARSAPASSTRRRLVVPGPLARPIHRRTSRLSRSRGADAPSPRRRRRRRLTGDLRRSVPARSPPTRTPTARDARACTTRATASTSTSCGADPPAGPSGLPG